MPPVSIVLITLDSHLSMALDHARRLLQRQHPGLRLSLHVASEWQDNPRALARCKAEIASGDIIVATMLFMDEHISAVLPDLAARRESCDAMIGCIAAGEVVRLTRLGNFSMDGPARGPMALLKKLRGSRKTGQSSGAAQLKMLRRLPRILKFIPGAAQDLRAYFVTMQYWLAGSGDNLANMVRFLINRYAAGPRAALRGGMPARPPVEHPDAGLYHPRLKGRVTERLTDLPAPPDADGRKVGVLLMRSYVLAGDTAHYDMVIDALERRGITPVLAFAAGLDGRPAIDAYFMKDGKARVDALLSLTGFSLVGGPAFNDASAAEAALAELDVPYLAAHALEFQSLDQWAGSSRGLTPVETTMMVAIPEIDGATGPMVFGGRADTADGSRERVMRGEPERAEMLAARLDRLTRLRNTPARDRKLAIVIFNFPPNAGATGTAAFLSVFESLYRTLSGLEAAGYAVEMPAGVEQLREAILGGNAALFGADANVVDRIPVANHVARERYLREIEAAWGPAPGRQQTDGATLHVLGARFGNVLVGVQPGFGYEGDPMRLMFEQGLAPTHAFSAFYRYLREDWGADAVLHFGTHGALEFMPGKQSGLSGACWPDRLIGDMPNFYLYAANNPSEGLIAKRRGAATLVSYMTPALDRAGLHDGLVDLVDSLDRWRSLPPDAARERAAAAELILAQAAELDLRVGNGGAVDDRIERIRRAVAELEETLIPHGLHILGRAPEREARIGQLRALAGQNGEVAIGDDILAILADGASPQEAAAQWPGAGPEALALLAVLARHHRHMTADDELPALLRALEGRFVRPAPGGDILRNPDVLPGGRNIHGFDPYRVPSALAMKEGERQIAALLRRHMAENGAVPRGIALVLWGTDNLKSEGAPIGQALALMGAAPRFDSFGRLCGARLISLEDLGRPRIDVIMTLSGIFRDLLPLQTKLLAEAAWLAASAEEEPESENYIRANALAYQAAHGGDLETAALRVFSNADGAYGANVNQMIDSGSWTEEGELAETYMRRKSFAYGLSGKPQAQPALLKAALAGVDLAYQNLESVELGVTTIDHYFDTLGGISSAVRRARGSNIPVYIADDTRGNGAVRRLGEQVALETHTRALNPKWYESLLAHGYEGVRQIESHITNTMGWSATTGDVAPWVYQKLTETFVLDDAMRARLSALNAKASARFANRLIEASERNYWQPDEATLEALRNASEELEDRLEGIGSEEAA